MSIELKRIYLENYKLFTMKEIVFHEYLSVFDGPNGYGKTSIFDAIELLISGSISRIKENPSISGVMGYSSNFLAKDQKKDVLIKGEFFKKSDNNSLVIALRIPAGSSKSSKKNNPKNIDVQVETFFLPQFDMAIERWADYSAIQDVATNKRNDFFGEQNIEFFTLLHYIRQEDRLSYFKKSEAERTVAIESLFGIEKYISKSEKIEQTQKQLYQKLGNINKEIDQLSKEVMSLPIEKWQEVEYCALVKGKPRWDYKEFNFRGVKSKDLYEHLRHQVNGLKELYIHRDEFYLFQDINKFYSISEYQRGLAVLVWKIQNENQNSIKQFQQKKWLREFLLEQKRFAADMKFAKVSWTQLCDVLGLKAVLNQFLELVNQINIASANQTDLQKSLKELNLSREKLRQEAQSVNVFEQGICPYCGQEWNAEKILEKQFEKTKTFIHEVLGREYTSYVILLDKCKKLYNEHCKIALDGKINELDHDIPFQVYSQFTDWQAYQNTCNSCDAIMGRLGIAPKDIRIADSLEAALTEVSTILKQISELKDTLSPEFYTLDSIYNFNNIYNENIDEKDTLNKLTVKALNEKAEYISNQYYHSFDGAINKLQVLTEQRDSLKKLQEQMKTYSQALKDAIKSYQQLVIGQIEIPFFLYSSRLLQSYQGGQGVLIKTDGKMVRFTAPGFEHDVLYTMSSGQLSAVLLAFSLALNKIYAGDNFQTVLIDDPIQCMDDINMISFVELLRREFSESQIILSTHEATFSNYIRYKFSKYNLTQQSITLKDS